MVRSLDRSAGSQLSDSDDESSEDIQSHIAGARNDSPSAAIPISDNPENIDSDVENGAASRQLPASQDDASHQANWRSLASLSLSALSGDSMWHQPRHSRSDRSR